jgi:hypothetical protein
VIARFTRTRSIPDSSFIPGCWAKCSEDRRGCGRGFWKSTSNSKSGSLRISEIRDISPDRLLVLGEIHLRGRESKVEFNQPMAWLLDFREGRVLRMEMFSVRSEALEAAGLSD